MARYPEWEGLPRVLLSTSAERTTSALIRAAATGKRILVIYHGGSTPGHQRWIRPSQVFVVPSLKRTYVEAFCESRYSIRHFRVDHLNILSDGDAPAPAGDARLPSARTDTKFPWAALFIGAVVIAAMCSG